ncbi:hypothetical protein GJ744_010804 [Endocarpon pusillum]|uniref:Uncharacterized protein n=1 Tax=Endocarpon pusillum TaxID=364733 RepID=A0A8H7AHN6_9EURO|nr:hypothetical protein GJ744_010804 [Endocarpon pusillum]
MDNINQIWGLGSSTKAMVLGPSREFEGKSPHLAEGLVVRKQQTSCSWLRDDVGHRKALFDRIGVYAHPG